MSALNDALQTFSVSARMTLTQRVIDAVTEAFVAGETHGEAHLLKHLDAYLIDAKDADLTVASEWKTRIEANPTDRITRGLGISEDSSDDG